MKRHIRATHELKIKQSVKCTAPDCEKVFESKSALNKHFKQAHGPDGPKSHACPECDQKFTKKAQLRVHLYSHTGEYPQKCSVCGAGFLNLKKLRHHMTTHDKLKNFCNRCTLAFPDEGAFVAHRNEVHAYKYPCPMCPNKFFSSGTKLKMHSIRHQIKDDDVFKCPFDDCEVTHELRYKLLEHIRRKHRDRKFKCPLCNVYVKDKVFMKAHMEYKHGSEAHHPPPDKRQQKPRKDIGVRRLAASTQLSGIKADPEVEKILLAGEGRRLKIQYSPSACALNSSATDTESEASSAPSNSYAF